MRVGIIAMARSGGHNLGEWIANELGTEFIHEPYLNGIEVDRRTNLVVKWLINEWGKFEIPKMDKWIGLYRGNHRECAISNIRAEETNRWHKPYTLTDEWIQQNEGRINEVEGWMREWDKVIHQNQQIELMVSYEGIYETGEDIQKITDYLGIEGANYLYMLNKSNRLRNKQIKSKTLI